MGVVLGRCILVQALARVGPGRIIVPPTPIGRDVTGATFTITVAAASDPLPEIHFAMEGSLDDGIRWMGAGGGGRRAGPKNQGPTLETPDVIAATFISNGDFWLARTRRRLLRGHLRLGEPVVLAAWITLHP